MPTPAKPLTQHALQGTKSEAAPTPDIEPSRPKYPRGISPDAKRVFKRLCNQLEKRRALTDGDGELLRLFSLAYDRHAKAIAKLAEEGEIRIYYRLDNHGESVPSEKPNLWLAIATDAEKFMTGCLDRLGLTPLNRSKVRPTATPKPKEADPMEELLQRGKPADALDEMLSGINEESVIQ